MGTDQATIDSYDEFARNWAKRARGKKKIAHDLLEKPAMYAKLPSLDGKKVLCLGCGSGEECEVLRGRGAAVTGIDISKGLIEQAKYAFPKIQFEVMDMEKLTLPDRTFDLVFSSLVLHYVSDWRPTLVQVKRVLKGNGLFLFSTHHPIKWAGEEKRDKEGVENLLGFKKYDSESNYKVYGDYLNARRITDVWSDEQKVVYYHKPFSDMLREIRESGFVINDLLEPKAIKAAVKVRSDFYEIHQKIPLFLVFELKK